jgi:elongation factor G
MSDPHVGKLTYFRVYSGKLDQGLPGAEHDAAATRSASGRILEMHAKDPIETGRVGAGDIVAGIGLKNTRTGDTLCDPTSPIVLEQLEFPDP